MTKEENNSKINALSVSIDDFLELKNKGKVEEARYLYSKIKNKLKTEKERYHQSNKSLKKASQIEQQYYAHAVQEAFLELNTKAGSKVSDNMIQELCSAQSELNYYLIN